MKFILIHFYILTLCFTQSCSFKAEDKDSKNSDTNIQTITKDTDSDGDLVPDLVEIEYGHDPVIANLPELSTNFIQDFMIEIEFKDGSLFELGSKVNRDDPDFKYKTGRSFFHSTSLEGAARVGRFSGVSSGEFNTADSHFVGYPEIDKSYIQSKNLEFDTLKKKQINNINIQIENTIELIANPRFSQIRDLELNFYYQNKKTQKWELIHTHKHPEELIAGISEDITIEITNPNKELIIDNLLRSGEFIVSEVKNFYIPELKTSYRELLASVKNKTANIQINTPISNLSKYVSINDKSSSFVSIMNKVFPSNFSVKDRSISKVEEFESNIGQFTNLEQLRGIDKKGNWFAMTEKMKDHFLKHKFDKGSIVSLSYFTGDELSKVKKEKIFSKFLGVQSTLSGKNFKLGNVSKNSEIQILIDPIMFYGKRLHIKKESFKYAPPRCRNCTGTNWGVKANYQINTFKEFSKKIGAFDETNILNFIELYLGNYRLDLDTLYENNQLFIGTIKNNSNDYLSLIIKDTFKLKEFKNNKDLDLILKLKAINVKKESEGVKLTKIEGKNIDLDFHAGKITYDQAAKRKLPLATTSTRYKGWERNVHWGKRNRKGFIARKGKIHSHYQAIKISIVTNITNFFN